MKDATEMQARRADLRPKDFLENAVAAINLAPLDPTRYRVYVRRAQGVDSPSVVEKVPGLVARLELMPATEHWLHGDPAQALRAADELAAKIDSLGDRAREGYADQLFQVYLELGRLDSAARCIRKVSDPLLQHELLSRVAFAKDDQDAVKQELEASEEGAWQRFPSIRTSILARAGLLPEAGRLLTQFEDCCSHEPYVQILRGDVALARGQASEGISQLEEGTKRDPNAPPYFLVGSESLAMALKKKGDLARGIEVLERASARRRQAAFQEGGPYWLRIRYQLAQIYRDSARENEARAIEEELRKLLALADPDHPIRRALDRLRGS